MVSAVISSSAWRSTWASRFAVSVTALVYHTSDCGEPSAPATLLGQLGVRLLLARPSVVEAPACVAEVAFQLVDARLTSAGIGGGRGRAALGLRQFPFLLPLRVTFRGLAALDLGCAVLRCGARLLGLLARTVGAVGE